MQLDKKLIGHEFEAFSTTVEAGKVKLFCKAIGEEDPIYVDEAAAKAAGYRAVPVPPTFLQAITNDDPGQGRPAAPAQRRYRPDPARRAALRLLRAGLRRRQDHLPAEGRPTSTTRRAARCGSWSPRPR